MSHEKPAWRVVFLSYPCETCDAKPGEECETTGGKVSPYPHAARTRFGNRCPKCGIVIRADSEPGTLCDRCALIRALETERASYYRRHDDP